MKFFQISIILIIFIQVGHAQNMNNERLQSTITEIADSIQGELGMWEIYVQGVPMLCITDEGHNRMRIISPISEINNLKKGQLKACMEANFHSALDVKYAISDEIIWSVYIHPLKELSEDQVKDAVIQVWNAAQTFGSSYSSTNLVFPGATENTGKKM